MMRRKTCICPSLATTVLFVAMFACSAVHGYQVLVHVGHDFTARELLEAKGWKQVAARANGVWGFDAWTRDISEPKDQDKVLAHVKSRQFYLAEFHWSPMYAEESPELSNPVIAAGQRASFENIWCMVYDESRYGSTLSIQQISRFRRLYPQHKLITNIRVFGSTRFAGELAALDGVSYEFNVLTVGQWSQHHPGQTAFQNIVEAIRWCIDHDKMIFLLIPPGDEQPGIEDRYIEAMKQLIRDLDRELEDKYLQSDNLVLVPATYDCRTRRVHNTPEISHGAYGNTGMGATLAAIDYRDSSRFKEPKDDAPEQGTANAEMPSGRDGD